MTRADRNTRDLCKFATFKGENSNSTGVLILRFFEIWQKWMVPDDRGLIKLYMLMEDIGGIFITKRAKWMFFEKSHIFPIFRRITFKKKFFYL